MGVGVVVMLEARLVDVIPATALQSAYRIKKRRLLASYGLILGCLSDVRVRDRNLSSSLFSSSSSYLTPYSCKRVVVKKKKRKTKGYIQRGEKSEKGY